MDMNAPRKSLSGSERRSFLSQNSDVLKSIGTFSKDKLRKVSMRGSSTFARQSILQSIQTFSQGALNASEPELQHKQYSGQVSSCGANTFGQLGTGDREDRNSALPLLDKTLLDVRGISCGGYFTICLTGGKLVAQAGEDGNAVVDTRNCLVFGAGKSGQLGLGDEYDQYVPESVEVLRVLQIRVIACGEAHAIAVSENGDVYAWGSNRYGQLGLGHTQSTTVPYVVTALQGRRIRQIACGRNHSVVVTDKAEVYAWGANQCGQLGIGSESPYESLPIKVKVLRAICAVAAGGNHSGFLSRSGDVYTVGENTNGRLGLGDKRNRSTPELVEKLRNKKIRKLCFGGMFNMALNVDGKVYSWGYGAAGSLGHGNDKDQLIPKTIKKIKKKGTVQISAGLAHAVILTESGSIWSWGQNTAGQLGHGHCMNLNSPNRVQMFEGKGVRQIACGYEHTIILGQPLGEEVMNLNVEAFGGSFIGTFSEEGAPRKSFTQSFARSMSMASSRGSVSSRAGSIVSVGSTDSDSSTASGYGVTKSSLFYKGAHLMRQDSRGGLSIVDSKSVPPPPPPEQEQHFPPPPPPREEEDVAKEQPAVAIPPATQSAPTPPQPSPAAPAPAAAPTTEAAAPVARRKSVTPAAAVVPEEGVGPAQSVEQCSCPMGAAVAHYHCPKCMFFHHNVEKLIEHGMKRHKIGLKA